MSFCPHCQSQLHQPEFCQGCFRALQAPAGGRFAGLLEQGFVGVAPSQSPEPGIDLMSVTFQPDGCKGRRWLPGLKQMVLGAIVLALGLVGAGLYKSRLYDEAVRHRQSGQALTRQGDFEGARGQLRLAPDEPETHRALAELGVAEGKWEEAAAEFRAIGVSDPEVNRHLDQSGLARARGLLRQARQTPDYVRALSFSDQAEQLLEQHHATAAQMAQLHFLRAQLFHRLDLQAETLAELEQTLSRDPNHAEALRLRGQLAPRPQPAISRMPERLPPARQSEPQVEFPRMQTDPGYPTYQPPEPEFPQYSSVGLESDSESSQKRRKKHRL